MTIRPASVADAQRVLVFSREFRAEGLLTVLQHGCLPTLAEEEVFISKLDGTAGIMLIALKDERVVGCLTGERAKHPQLCHSCEFGMGVLQKQRGAGIGSALIASHTEWAKSVGLRRIQLKVLVRNAGAVRLYRRLGYEVEGRKKEAIRIGDRYEDLIEMARRI